MNGEKLLGTLKRHDLEVIDEWLRVVDNEVHATKNWFNELRNEEIDRINSVFAELVLLYHLRKIYGNDCVSLNSRAGAKEFDLRLTTEQEDVWIKVTMPEFTEGLLDSGERKTLNTTQNSMERKLESTLEETRNRAPEDAVLVLAIYCEEQINQSYATQLELDEGHYDTGEVCDGWLYYTHLRDTQIEYQPVSDAGERVRTLVNRMVEE